MASTGAEAGYAGTRRNAGSCHFGCGPLPAPGESGVSTVEYSVVSDCTHDFGGRSIRLPVNSVARADCCAASVHATTKTTI
jgi:hypothetical protein